MKVHYFYPYLANDGKNNFYIITKSAKKTYFGAARYTDFSKHKMKVVKTGIFYGMRKMKIGLNQVLPVNLPQLGFGVIGYHGISQALKKVMKILKNDFCNIILWNIYYRNGFSRN